MRKGETKRKKDKDGMVLWMNSILLWASIICFFFGITAVENVRAEIFENPFKQEEPNKLCPQVKVKAQKNLKFDETEKRMLCGDPTLGPWSVIPPYQARLFMTGFLQSRGYLTPKFEIKDNTLFVEVGEQTEVEEILISPQDLLEADYVQDEIWGLYQGKTITPPLLSSMEANVVGLLREKSYACAKFKALANANNGVVILNGEQLKRFKFGKVKKQEIYELYENALDRYYPFAPEYPFNAEKLKLTEKRLKRSGVVEGSYFLENCHKELEEFQLEHHYILGPPRVFGFGVGVSTEVGPMFRARWRHNRYGPMASNLEATVQTDLRKQSLNLWADNYFWRNHPRASLDSEFALTREEQVDYRESQVSLASHPKITRDSQKRYYEVSLGPTYLNGTFSTDEGDEGSYSGIALEGSLISMAHRYEIFDFLPEEGSFFRFHFSHQPTQFGFEDDALKLEAQHTALGRLFRWGRGAAVGGLRLGAFTTVVDQPSVINDLQPSMKFYGGGSDDIRGFGYRQLPDNDGVGALSKLLAKFEFRRTHFFVPGLEMFLFYDAGYFGFDSWELSPRLRQSPGIGLRWVSPVGLLQTFVAQGTSTNPYEQEDFVVFIGLGGEF